MDDSGADRFGRDGTQPPPPPPLFPDPLAGLVTGERYEAKAALPVVPPTPPVVPRPDPPHVPPARRAQARKPVRAPAQQVSGQPAAHAPHAELARQPAVGQQATAQPKKGRGGLIGCLIALAVLSGLLFNVVREIIEAVVDLLR